MSDSQSLYLVVVLIYLAECATWTAPDAVHFYAATFRAWKWRRPSFPIGISRSGFVFANPLAPLERSVLASHPPLSISPAGVVNGPPTGLNAPRRSPLRVVPLDEFGPLSVDGSWLLAAGARFARFQSKEQARDYCELLVSLAKEPSSRRTRRIERFLESRLSAKRFRKRLAFVQRRTAMLLALCNIAWMAILAVCPAVVWWLGAERALAWALVTGWSSAALVAASFWSAHASLLPLERSDRVIETLKMLLCPPAAIRAIDTLEARVMVADDAIVAASLLLSTKRRDAFLRELLRDLRHPLLDPEATAASNEIVHWWRDAYTRAALAFLRSADIPLPADEPPSTLDRDAVAYCPRCIGQYGQAVDECPDCPGVELLPLVRSDFQA